MEVLFQTIGFSSPLFTSAICLIVMAAAYRRNMVPERRLLLRLVILFYVASAFTWFSMGLYLFNTEILVYLHTVTFLTMLSTQVLVYHLVFLLTQTGGNGRFPMAHYVMPFVLSGGLALWSAFVPFDVQLHILQSRGMAPAGYEVYTAFFTSKMPLYFVFNVVYSIAGLVRNRRFQRMIGNYSADLSFTSPQWLYLLLIVTLAGIPLALGFLILGKAGVITWPGTLLLLLLIMFQDIVIGYNMFTGNYILISYPAEEENSDADTGSKKISRHQLENYMSAEKPFLDPKVKITDLVVALHTNRTYLSAFINSEYKMNFSRFINRYRLQELEKLRTDPDYIHLTGIELVQYAGFGNYGAYQRAMSTEREEGQLMVND